MDQDRITLDELRSLTLDLNEITLGDMAAVEIASGSEFSQLIRHQTSRRLVALFLRELKSSGDAPSWSSLSSRRLRVDGSSTSPSSPAGLPPTSQD